MPRKAITPLKLHVANSGKLAALDAVASEYQHLTQAFVNSLLEADDPTLNKYAVMPGLPSPLSARWLRCAWQQACGIVQSGYSKARTNPPVLKHMCMQANANVVVLERSKTPTFDDWLRITTLDKGQPVRVPVKLYKNCLLYTSPSPRDA